MNLLNSCLNGSPIIPVILSPNLRARPAYMTVSYYKSVNGKLRGTSTCMVQCVYMTYYSFHKINIHHYSPITHLFLLPVEKINRIRVS